MQKIVSFFKSGSVLLFIGTVFFCVLVGELIVRRHIFGDTAWSYTKMVSIRHIGQSGLLQASANQEILWELRPNVNTIYKMKPFVTNNMGLRDRNYSVKKPQGVFRVAVIGDSFTMGEGIAIEDAYHTLLERRFNSSEDERRYEFINFGVAGYSLVQYLATIKDKALQYSPDIILIGFCAANDSEPPNFEAFKKPYKVKPVENGFLNMYSFELIGDGYKYFYNKLRNRFPGYDVDPPYVDREFRELAELSASAKVPVVIAYIDNKKASADFPIVKAAAARYGFDFIDATPNFPKTVATKYIIYKTDNHPNAAANKVMADSLYAALKVSRYFSMATKLL